jgi:hypothetical protein
MLKRMKYFIYVLVNNWFPLLPASLAFSFKKLQLLFAENKTQGRKTQLTRASLNAGK